MWKDPGGGPGPPLDPRASRRRATRRRRRSLTRDGHILSNVVSSQAELHARFGGVVPEVASRRHLELVVPPSTRPSRRRARRSTGVEQVAVTRGPGLAGRSWSGSARRRRSRGAGACRSSPSTICTRHVASLFLGDDPLEPPFLCLLASGGHTLLLDVRDHSSFETLGQTIDDAAGEAFDKGARLLGLGYPGGPALDRLARERRPHRLLFPGRARAGPRLLVLRRQDRAAVRRARPRARPPRSGRADLAASYQRALVRALAERTLAGGRGDGADGSRSSEESPRTRELRAALDGAALRPARALHRQRGDGRFSRSIRGRRPLS